MGGRRTHTIPPSPQLSSVRELSFVSTGETNVSSNSRERELGEGWVGVGGGGERKLSSY